MAHGIISQSDFVAKSADCRVNAWHGIGRYLACPTLGDIAPMFDWQIVAERPVGVVSDDIDLLVRSDNRRLLGTASRKYKPFQNESVIAEFVEPLLMDGYTIETSGVLWGGTSCFVAMTVEKQLILDGNNPLDVARPILTMSWGHDGKTPVRAFYGAVRVVCANTLAMGLSGAEEMHNFRHSGNVASKAEELKKCVLSSTHYYSTLETDYRKLAATPYDGKGEIVDKLLKNVLGDPYNMDLSGNLRTRSAGRWKSLFNVFAEKRADQTTLGGWYSAVDETIDHSDSEKDTVGASASDNRFESLVLGGKKSKIKSALFEQFLAMAE